MPEAFGASAFRFLGDLAEIGCCRSVVGDWTGWRSSSRPMTNYGQPSHSLTPRPITHSRSAPWSQGSSSVNRLTHSRYEHGILVRSVPQNVR